MSAKGSLVYQSEKILKSKIAFGDKRHEDKKQDRINNTAIAKEKIYSFNTIKTYQSQCTAFTNYVKKHHPECKTIEQCRMYADEYLQYNIDRCLSPYTIKTQVSALSKLYGDTAKDYIRTPARSQKEIVRSRNNAVRDKNFSAKNNQLLIAVSESTGLRRSELKEIRGIDIRLINDKFYLYVHRGTKGGKARLTEIYHPDNDKRNMAIRAFLDAGNKKIFKNVHSAYDAHNARSIYARNLYKKYERNIDTLPRSV
jgi:integrase